MGKALRQEHIDFFTARMNDHDQVVDWEPIMSEEEYLFKVTRMISGYKSEVIVHLTDAYRYGLAEFYARPAQLGSGSFVVVGMPHADAATEAIETAKMAQIGIGHIGKLMGALNYERVWEYMTPDERREEEMNKQRRKAGRSGRNLPQ